MAYLCKEPRIHQDNILMMFRVLPLEVYVKWSDSTALGQIRPQMHDFGISSLGDTTE